MRLPRLLSAALLVVPAALVAVLPGAQAAMPTYPAECAPVVLTDEPAVDALAREADHVFAGTVKSEAPVEGTTKVGYQVKVIKSFIGKVAKDKPALVTIDWAGKAPTVAVGSQNVFFTAEVDGAAVADHCNGAVPLPAPGLTEPLADQLTAFLESVEPVPAPAPEVRFEKPDPTVGDPPELGRVVATGGAVSLVGLLGLVLVSRLGRRH